MEAFLKISESVFMTSVAIFPITTAIMLFSLKRRGYDPIGNFVESKWSIDINLRFFSTLRKTYVDAGNNTIIPFLNAVTFYITTFGVIFFPVLLVIYNLW